MAERQISRIADTEEWSPEYRAMNQALILYKMSQGESRQVHFPRELRRRPEFEVTSFGKLEYRPYGKFIDRARARVLSGYYALEAVLPRQVEEAVLPMAVITRNERRYHGLGVFDSLVACTAFESDDELGYLHSMAQVLEAQGNIGPNIFKA